VEIFQGEQAEKVVRRNVAFIERGGHIIWNPYTKKGKRQWMLMDRLGGVEKW